MAMLGSIIIFYIILLIVVAVIIFAVYSSIYKKKINKKLEQNESTAHVSMLPTESIGKIILIVGGVIFAISVMSMLSTISANVQNTQNNLNNTISSLQCEIRELKDMVEEQNSEFIMFECEIGEIDNANHTVNTMFRCIPKKSGEDTKIRITVGKDTITLEKNADGIFTGEKPLPMFDNSYSEVCASIETNGVTSSMWIMENDYYFLSDVCLPQLENLRGLNYNFGKNSFSLSGTYYNGGISNYSGAIITDKRMDELNDIKVTFSVNGEIVEEIEITDMFMDIDIDVKIPAKSGDTVKVEAVGTDKYGYTHKRLLLETDSEGSQSWSEADSIYDKNGNFLNESIYTNP